MHASAAHRDHCLTILPRLESCFRKWGNDTDNLLDCVAGPDSIGSTIASGLIWSITPRSAVPFEKRTMAYALQKRIPSSPRILNGNYSKACQKITIYCDTFVYNKQNGSERRYEIKDFVRYALQEASGYEWSPSPI